LGSIIGYILLSYFWLYILSYVNIVFQEFEYLILYFYVFCILFVWVSFFMKLAVAHKIYELNIWAYIACIWLFVYLELHMDKLNPESYINTFIITLISILLYSMSIFFYRILFAKK
jgi:hypothetical protein